MAVEQQGWGPITEGYGAPLRKLLQARQGQPTLVCLADGRQLLVYDIAWSRDAGDWWEHVTCNTAPDSMRQRRDIHLIHLSDVESLRDPQTGDILQSQSPRPGAK